MRIINYIFTGFFGTPLFIPSRKSLVAGGSKRPCQCARICVIKANTLDSQIICVFASWRKHNRATHISGNHGVH